MSDDGASGGSGQGTPAERGLWRAAAVTVLLTIGVILVPVTAASWWVCSTLADTDRYVATVAPLASDPQVQTAVRDQVTDRVMARLAGLNLAQRATDELIARGVPPQLAAAVGVVTSPVREQTESRVSRVVGDVVSSDGFASVWTDANRVAHTQLIRLLAGDTTAVELDETGQLVLDLSAISGQLRTALVSAGVPGADRLPDIDAQVVIGDGNRIERAQGIYGVIEGAPVLLLVVTVALLAVGIALSRRRLRATVWTLAGMVVATLVALAAVALAREYAADNLPADVRAAAEAVVTLLTDRLRALLRIVGWIALIALVVTLVSGHGSRAAALRRQVRDASEATWRAAQSWQHTVVVSLAVALVCVVVLFVTDLPTAWNLLLIAVAVLAGVTAWGSSAPGGPGEDRQLASVGERPGLASEDS